MRYVPGVRNGALILGAMIGLAGCGGDGNDRCAVPLTYERDIEPIATAKCANCHAPGAERRGAPSELNYHDWPSIEPVVAEFADAITSGLMPPIGFEPTITPEERELVIEWRACGFRE